MVMTPVQLLPVSRVFAALCPRESNETETEVDLPRPRGMEEQENRSGVTPRSAAPREVHVSGVAELSAAPDRARVSVCLSSCKETANDAKSSVNRRLEYILQSMRQHGVQEENLTVTKTFRRRENAYNMEVEICVIFEDFEKMQTISNLLVEKLDISVTISPPHFYHSPESVEALRRRVCLAAVGNARRKAQESSHSSLSFDFVPLVVLDSKFAKYLVCGKCGPGTDQGKVIRNEKVQGCGERGRVNQSKGVDTTWAESVITDVTRTEGQLQKGCGSGQS
ncbi:hypothetical protein NDU88_003797 [Pleurodeles waltl]|uniref:Interleukin-1 receptor-associated kinase 1-binding protein 1 n=1 Tax=Pleurodeles waltl TaxID=8319 RepID=A0AAV7RJK6_PLEWA|nr:hypothetical protein NDU88_003797 [Pleurodeles waltl]